MPDTSANLFAFRCKIRARISLFANFHAISVFYVHFVPRRQRATLLDVGTFFFSLSMFASHLHSSLKMLTVSLTATTSVFRGQTSALVYIGLDRRFRRHMRLCVSAKGSGVLGGENKHKKLKWFGFDFRFRCMTWPGGQVDGLSDCGRWRIINAAPRQTSR